MARTQDLALSSRAFPSALPSNCAYVVAKRCCSAPAASDAAQPSIARQALGKIGGTKDLESYLIAFTCKVCETRAAKKISKQAYHKGVVLIQCECCKNRHLIADNLGWFEENPVNVEDLCRRNGQEVIRSGQFTEEHIQLDGIDLQLAEPSVEKK